MPDMTDDFGGSPDPWWRDCAERAVLDLATSGNPFTVDRLREAPYSLPEPHHPNAWGALFRAMQSAGYIEPLGYETSSRASRHGSPVRRWRGTEYLRSPLAA